MRLSTEMLIACSCALNKPLADPTTLQRYLDLGQIAKLRRQLEADAKSLLALYSYTHLHGAVRVVWGHLDEMLPANWVQPCEIGWHRLKERALEQNQVLELVLGRAPSWQDPWARAERCYPIPDDRGYGVLAVDHQGYVLDGAEVQLARVVERRPGDPRFVPI